MSRAISRGKPLAERRYLEEEVHDFDERLLSLKLRGTVYLDGYWQSEEYFKDVEATIRRDLRIIEPQDANNRRLAEAITSSNAVAVHVRWFDAPGSGGDQNASGEYYRRAVEFMDHTVDAPHYFVFSEFPREAVAYIGVPKDRVTAVDVNSAERSAYADLWLMTLCRHFIIANSTFSWWGAWLGGPEKVVVCPAMVLLTGRSTVWGTTGQIPHQWKRL